MGSYNVDYEIMVLTNLDSRGFSVEVVHMKLNDNDVNKEMEISEFYLIINYFNKLGRLLKHKMELTTGQVLCQVERRFHSREAEPSTSSVRFGYLSPPSSRSLGSSQTRFQTIVN